MKKFFNVIAVVCAFLIAGFVSCKAPSSGGGNGSGIKSNPVTTGVTVANIAEIIAGLTEDSTIVMSGEVKSADIETIKNAIDSSQYLIDLDLTGVTGLTEIPKRGFGRCEKLCGITLPDTVTAIGDLAFFCKSLTSINIDSNNEKYCSVEGVLFNKDKTELVIFPCGKSGLYTIPDYVKTIGRYAFYRCDKLTEFIIPDSVKTIGGGAFEECTNLEKVTIGKSVESIGGSAFRCCEKLTEITIPDSVKIIGDFTFCDCTNLEKVTIGKSVESIGESAFQCCYKLTEITIPESVETIGIQAFSTCSKLKNITIPDSVKEIKPYAFGGCTNLEKVTIGKSVETIGNYAFEVCEKLKDVTIPKSVEWLGIRAFSSCEKLTSITFEDPSGWYVVNSKDAWENKTGGTSVDFSDPRANVSTLNSADSSSRFFKLTSE
ncbi:MAG: leucine-rich repeat protein [Treponema sp.]|nr:leucine-rich repeat protein [Treponema sp.]